MTYDCNNEWHYFGMHGFWWFFFVILVILVIVLFNRTKRVDSNTEDSSLKILKNRFASGDISKEEFEEKKKALNN